MVPYIARKFFPLSVTTFAQPTTQDFTNLGQNLFGRMVEHKPLQEKFQELGIESAFFCLADQTGIILHEFMVGSHSHGSVPLADELIARKIATLTGIVTGRISSREIRMTKANLFAGSVRGMKHIISCRLVAVQPLSQSESVAVEDLSELVAIIFGYEVKKRMGLMEIPKDYVMGFLSRYRSPHLPLFDPFL